MAALAVLGRVFAVLPGINQLLAFGSLTFLGVFGLIDHLHARTAQRRGERLLGHAGTVLCTAAVVVMVVQLAIDDPVTLAFITACLVGVAVLRSLHVRRRRHATPTA